MVNTEVNTDFQSNVGLPTFRFRLKKFDKIQNSAHFDHWNIPLRLLFFIQQTECYDGLFHLQYCMIPEDCHIVLFDSEQNAAPVVLDYGQNGKDKPYVQTPLEVFEKSERLSVVKDCQPHVLNTSLSLNFSIFSIHTLLAIKGQEFMLLPPLKFFFLV
ncbi:hypothetical protein HMI55_001122, partial [Coelomomyces lativittatus]